MSMGSCSVLYAMIGMVNAMRLPWCSANAMSCGVDEPVAQMNVYLGVVSRRRKPYGLTLSLKGHQTGAEIASRPKHS